VPVVLDRGDRHGDREDSSVFALPNGLVVQDALAVTDLAEDLLASATRSGGQRTVIGWPMISSAAYPYMRSAAGFQVVITPSVVFPMIASSDELTIAASRSAASIGSRRVLTVTHDDCSTASPIFGYERN
jgi:hypothetical protein